MRRLATAITAGFVLLSGTAFGQDDTAAQRASSPGLPPAPALYVAEVTDAAREFLASLDEARLGKVLAAFDSPERISGRDTSRTPAFCAVLAWCIGWGVPQCDLTYPQQRALARLLTSALSDSGYQTVRAILNSHRLIGELEEVADADFVSAVAKQCPEREADAVFDVPAPCQPHGGTPDYVALGGATPTNATGD
jgi:hypothetical protein